MNNFGFADNWDLQTTSGSFSFGTAVTANYTRTLGSDFKIGVGGPGAFFLVTTGTGATASAHNIVSAQVLAYPFSSGQNFSGQGAAVVFNTTSAASANAGLVWANKLSANALGGHPQYGLLVVTMSETQTGSATIPFTFGLISEITAI